MINVFELFPTKLSYFIFILYISLFISQSLLVTASQNSGSYAYNTILAVSLTELVKLIICTGLYSVRNPFLSLFQQAFIHLKLLWLYLIPTLLYCLYNNLSYVNLLAYDPTTYMLLLQLRVVITGVLFQMLFKKKLNAIQWFSLILLTIGCMVKSVNFDEQPLKFEDQLPDERNTTRTMKYDGMGVNVRTGLIFIQVLCSCFSGVYTEYLLKNEGINVNIFIQNTFMYFESVICNAVLVVFWQWDSTVFTQETVSHLLDYKVMLIVLNNALAGIVTSFFLKHLNSILKTVASALELIIAAVLSWLMFNIPIRYNTAIAIVIVTVAIVLYARSPVHNPPATTDKHKSVENV